MTNVYALFEKPSALTADERAEYVRLWEASCARRLRGDEASRYRALRARMERAS